MLENEADNVHYKRVVNSPPRRVLYLSHSILPQHAIGSPSKEARLLLALEAIQNDKKPNIFATAKLYNVLVTTLRRRRASCLARRDTTPNSRRLTNSEEKAIIQYIIKLDTRSFLPRLHSVEDIANQLLRVRDARPVGKLWAHNFVKRQPEL